MGRFFSRSTPPPPPSSSSPSSSSTISPSVETLATVSIGSFIIGAIKSLWRDFIWFDETVIVQFDKVVQNLPHKTAIIYHGERYRFVDLQNRSNQIAHWLTNYLGLITNNVDDDELVDQQSSSSSISSSNNSATNSKCKQIVSKQTPPPQSVQIGLLLGNTPELVTFMLALARVRATGVLFNTNHRRDTLMNAFRAVPNCRAIVFEIKYLNAIREIATELPEDMSYFVYDRNHAIGGGGGGGNYDDDTVTLPSSCLTEKNNNDILIKKSENLLKDTTNQNKLVVVATTTCNNDNDDQIRATYCGMSRTELLQLDEMAMKSTKVKLTNFAVVLNHYPTMPISYKCQYKLTDNLTYVFTSGTTGGAIKSTPTNNIRYIAAYLSQEQAFGITTDDNVYISLPLYHSFPGVIGLGRCILGGNTITLADKFSASRFWSDVAKNQCTIALYIGEICRYLLAQPPRPEEKQHSLRMMHGLGMKKEIWHEFCTRFKVEKFAEFYGSSEGNINLFNYQNVPGSCGFIPYYFGPLARLLYPVYLIRVDPLTLQPIRSTRTGICKLARPGEIGLVVGEIKDGFEYTKFLGYTSTEETEKKIIRDILTKGDLAFASGDLMQMDLWGNLYFKDRTGDTFRWKGENVSTSEVESIAAQFLNPNICTVYGVSIPYTDGRAGMIAIQQQHQQQSDDTLQKPMKKIDLIAFARYMMERLPEYAVPKFIRITTQLETTTTYKLIKYKLREAGYNPRFMMTTVKTDEATVDAKVDNNNSDSNCSSSSCSINDCLYYLDRATGAYQPLTLEVYDRIQSGEIRF